MVRASSLGTKKINKSVLIPFDANGNMQNWSNSQPGVVPAPFTGASAYAAIYQTAAWKPNYEFLDTLEYKDMRKGRSALNATFVSKTDGKEYVFFMKDFHDVIPKMKEGILAGKFTFVKRGANFGILLLPATQAQT